MFHRRATVNEDWPLACSGLADRQGPLTWVNRLDLLDSFYSSSYSFNELVLDAT